MVKRKATKPKAPVKPKDERMEATEDPYKRERFFTRRTLWLWRLRPFLLEKNKDQCGTCQMNGRCNRIPLNAEITNSIAAGKGCPDHKSVWKQILGKDEEYDWGF